MILTLLLVSLTILSIADADPPGGYYTTRYDHIDIENILNQKRLVQYYGACLLDKGPCTPQGIEFKRILPEAIKTNCLRCTEKQRVVTLRSIRRLRKEYPDVWGQLAASWDPTGEYVKQLEQSVHKPSPPRSPSTIPPSTPPPPRRDEEIIGDRFGDIGSDTKSTTSKPSTTTTVKRTTLKLLLPSTTTTKPKITTRKKFARPFNSIGPNLVVPNPKVLIDAIGNKVISTAGIVLNTVQSVLKG